MQEENLKDIEKVFQKNLKLYLRLISFVCG